MNEIKIFISCLKQYMIIGNVSFVVKRKKKSLKYEIVFLDQYFGLGKLDIPARKPN